MLVTESKSVLAEMCNLIPSSKTNKDRTFQVQLKNCDSNEMHHKAGISAYLLLHMRIPLIAWKTTKSLVQLYQQKVQIDTCRKLFSFLNTQFDCFFLRQTQSDFHCPLNAIKMLNKLLFKYHKEISKRYSHAVPEGITQRLAPH